MNGPHPIPDGTSGKDAETKLSVIEASKRLAAWTAVDHHILEHHKVCSCFQSSPSIYFSFFLFLILSFMSQFVLHLAVYYKFAHVRRVLGHRYWLRLNRSLCRGTHCIARRGTESRSCFHPYRFVAIVSVLIRILYQCHKYLPSHQRFLSGYTIHASARLVLLSFPVIFMLTLLLSYRLSVKGAHRARKPPVRRCRSVS